MARFFTENALWSASTLSALDVTGGQGRKLAFIAHENLGWNFLAKASLCLSGTLRISFRVPAQFGLCVDVVLLDTEFEVIPFFAATAIFRIFGIKAAK